MILLWQIAISHLWGRKRQTLVSVLGVAMGVGFSIAMASLMEGSQRDFISRVVDYLPHVIIKDEFRVPPKQAATIFFPDAAVDVRGIKPREEERGIKEAANKVEFLESVPSLKVAPALRGQVFLRYGGKDATVSIVGIEPDRERNATRIEKDIIQGGLNSLYGAPNGMIIGQGLAKKMGIGMNATLTAVSSAGVTLKMKVVGIFRTGIISVDQSEVYVLMKKSQIIQNRSNAINQIRIRLENAELAQSVARDIESRWGYKTESWQESNEGFLGAFEVRNAVMFITVSAILIVASFGIFNIVSTVVHEKYRDIAILKSLGFETRNISQIFLFEGLMLGILGAFLGWALGFCLCFGLSQVRFKIQMLTEMQGFVLYYSVWHYVLSGGLALFSASFAAYLPARKAARLNPVEIIRGAA